MHVPHHLADVHAIEMAWTVIEQLQISEHVTLQINSLGDEGSRAEYRKVLESYLNTHKEHLSALSRSRLERGSVLRVLDSKEPEDSEVVLDAPTLDNHLSQDSSTRFNNVLAGLDALGLPYTINQRLVRGLDYYNDTCFEFVTKDGQAVVAGGRYDKLAEIMGGVPTAGVGWAAGIERLALLLPEALVPAPPRPVAVIPVSDASNMDEMWASALRLTHSLRSSGIAASMAYDASPAKHTKRAAKEGCKYCIYIGSDEIQKGTVRVKDLDTASQFECSLEELKSLFPLYTPH